MGSREVQSTSGVTEKHFRFVGFYY